MAKLKKRDAVLNAVEQVIGARLPVHGLLLLCGPAGVGKSTLLIQVLEALALEKTNTEFISTEQSVKDLSSQFPHLRPAADKYFTFEHITHVEDIKTSISASSAAAVVLDSIHCVDGVRNAKKRPISAGHYTGIKHICAMLRGSVSAQQTTVFVTGHLTRDGMIAGGTSVLQLFDAVLTLKPANDDQYRNRRVLECISKNRFGPRGNAATLELCPVPEFNSAKFRVSA